MVKKKKTDEILNTQEALQEVHVEDISTQPTESEVEKANRVLEENLAAAVAEKKAKEEELAKIEAKRVEELSKAKAAKISELKEKYKDFQNKLTISTILDTEGNTVSLQLDTTSLSRLDNIPLLTAISLYRDNKIKVVRGVNTASLNNDEISEADLTLLQYNTLSPRVLQIIKDIPVDIRDVNNEIKSVLIKDLCKIRFDIAEKTSDILHNKWKFEADILACNTIEELDAIIIDNISYF